MSRQNSRQRRGRPSIPKAAMAAFRCKAVLLGAVLLSTLAGCAPAPELGPDTARALQAQVLAVTEAAAADDPAGSLKLLDELGIQLEQAAAGGGVSLERQQSIRTAIGAVRADLAARQAAAEAARAEEAAAEQAAAEQAAAEQAAAEQAAAERKAAEQAAAEQAAAEQAAAPPAAVVAPAPAPADNAKDKGKGPDNGKGPGKG